MAEASNITFALIEADLRDLWSEVDGIPVTFARWYELDEEARLDFVLEWDNLIGGFRQLVQAEAAGLMTPAQYGRYVSLVRRYESVLPAIEHLGLQTIPIPKLTAPAHAR